MAARLAAVILGLSSRRTWQLHEYLAQVAAQFPGEFPLRPCGGDCAQVCLCHRVAYRKDRS